MGTRFTVGGIDFNASDYSVTEDSTGLALNDSSGGVGEVRVTVDKPTPEEIRDMPSPYPDAVTLTPILPGYYEDLEDFITYVPVGGSIPTYEQVDISPSSLGATRVLRLTLPPGSYISFLPGGGARVLRDLGLVSQFRFSSAPGITQHLPTIDARDAKTGANQISASSFIVREIPEVAPTATYLSGGWMKPGVAAGVDLRVMTPGVEYGVAFDNRPELVHHAAVWFSVANPASNTGNLVVDLVTLGVFSLPEGADLSSWNILFTGFVNSPPGSVTSWDSGSPSGLASRYPRNVPDRTPWVRSLAPTIFEGMNFTLEDSEYGRIPGVVEGVSETDDSWEFTGVSVLGLFNTRDVTLPPFEGTASQALREFARAAGVPWIPVYVDPGINSEVLRLGRRQGELWNLMKQFAAGLGAEISLVDGTLVLRRPRLVNTEPGRYLSRGVSPSNQDARHGVILQTETLSDPEVETNSSPGPNVYPGGQINTLLPVISVPGGDSVEMDIPLGYEIAGLRPPPPDVRTVAVYDDLNTFVGEFLLPAGLDDLQVDVNHIVARRLRVRNNWYRKHLNLTTPYSLDFSLSIARTPSEDRTVRVVFRAPKIVDSDGRERTFSLSAIQGGAQVNGLQLRAAWGMKVGALQSSEFPTGAVSAPSTTSEVLYTKSVSWSPDRISSAGFAASRRAAGRYRNLSGTVDRLRPPYESNYYSSAPYSDAQDFVGGDTYGGVVGAYGAVVSPVDYREVQRYWDQNYDSSIKTWVFGNVAGARIWDEASNNFYRVRSATITPAGISLSAETDTVHGDVDPLYVSEGLSYFNVTSRARNYIHLTYEQASASGYLKDPANA